MSVITAPPFTLPSIPNVPGNVDAQLRPFLEAIKTYAETQQASRPNSNPMDKVLTLRDLVDSGLGAANIGGRIVSRPRGFTSGSGLQSGDFTPPPAVTGFSASGAIISIILSWNHAPASANVEYYEIFRAQTDNLGVAIKIATTQSNVYTDPVGAG